MTLPTVLSDTLNAMANTTKQTDMDLGGDFLYLKMSKQGEWLYGADDTEVADGMEFAVDVASFMRGFQAWDNGDFCGEEIRPLTDVPLLKSELEDVGAPWKPLLGFGMRCIKGPKKAIGTALLYKTTSRGGLDAINDLMKNIVKTLQDPKRTEGTVPIIQLASDWYKHSKYGKIYTPILDIVDWKDETDDLSTAAVAEPELEPEPEPEPEPETRVRRRRRTA